MPTPASIFHRHPRQQPKATMPEPTTIMSPARTGRILTTIIPAVMPAAAVTAAETRAAISTTFAVTVQMAQTPTMMINSAGPEPTPPRVAMAAALAAEAVTAAAIITAATGLWRIISTTIGMILAAVAARPAATRLPRKPFQIARQPTMTMNTKPTIQTPTRPAVSAARFMATGSPSCSTLTATASNIRP